MPEILLAYSWYTLFHLLPTTPSGWAWFCFGLSGNLAFFSRFLVQWLYSERHKESRIPIIFWYQSIIGTLILLLYFVHRHDLIGILGYVVNIIPYTRNLMLVYGKRRELAAAAVTASTANARGFDVRTEVSTSQPPDGNE